MKLHNLYTLTCLLLSPVLGSTQYRLESGELFTAGEHDRLQPHIEPEQNPSTQVHALFARQICYAPKSYCSIGCCDAGLWCCERTSCIDISTYTCCTGGTQCLIGKECCGIGCCKAGGQCCSNHMCCGPGTMCVIDTLTGSRGCLPDGSMTGSPTVTMPTVTLPTVTPTTVRQNIVPTCLDPGFNLCGDQRFCCPAGTYCYYDTRGRPACWGGNAYYTLYYYYSWSYSFGIRWYAATTSYHLGGTDVAAITTPPRPTTPQPTSNTVTPPTNTQDLELTTPSMALPPGSAMGTPTSTSTSTSKSTPTSESTPTPTSRSTPTSTTEIPGASPLGSEAGEMRPAILKEALVVVVLVVAFFV